MFRLRSSRRLIAFLVQASVVGLAAAGALTVSADSPPSQPPPAYAPADLSPAASSITFGRPTISGIQGTGFEQGAWVADDGVIYTHVPGTLSSATSWIWVSRDGGKTFKWVPGSAPLTGKLPTCVGGGDTEVVADSAGNIYFNDLTLANFSVARSEDGGRTFTPPSCISTATTPNDRQWYGVDGDPTAGGNLYLTYNIVGADPAACPAGSTNVGNNQLVLARSPGLAGGASAGVAFAPSEFVSGPCDEAIMGNVEVSPVSHRIFVVHDSAALDAILMARCETVPFTTRPSGLSCVDLPVASFPGFETGANFPTMAIDAAGNLFVVWEAAPVDANGNPTGDTLLYWSSSTDEGQTWRTPAQIPTPGLHHNIYAWLAAGSAGRVGIAWLGTDGQDAPGGCSGPDGVVDDWTLYYSQTLNGTAAVPTFTAPIDASEGPVGRGSPWTIMGGQCGADRIKFGDFIHLRMGPDGEANISYSDSRTLNGIIGQGMFVRQNGGPSLLASDPVVTGDPAPVNSVTDPAGDATYEANGLTGASQPNLDLLSSSIEKVGDTFVVTMKVADLRSLAPAPSSGNPDTNLVWSTQWVSPSSSDPNGGRHFHAYMESTNGAAPSFFVGETAVEALGGGVMFTYPGSTAVTGSYTPTAPGTITIEVPEDLVDVANPLSETLYSVTSATMTLQQPANSVPSFGGVGGVFFNLIDPMPAYDFVPGFVTTFGHAHSDYSGNGKAGPGDVHIQLDVSGGGSESVSGPVLYDDLRGNPPGLATSNIRCTGTPTAVQSLSASSVRITGTVSCTSLSKAKTFELTVTDNGVNPPRTDGYRMVLRNRRGVVVYDWTGTTTAGLGDLRV